MAKSITKKNSSSKAGVVSNKETAPVIKFKNDDMILCKSVLPGITNVKGEKTGDIYSFRIVGDEIEIAYQDLKWMVQARSKFLFHPFIIVLNDDFIEQNSILKDFYNQHYTSNDLNALLKMKPKEMCEMLDKMPPGIKNSVKSMAATMIGNGELDSVSTIKALDKYFGTKLMLITGLYND